jgi:hypothetical protein
MILRHWVPSLICSCRRYLIVVGLIFAGASAAAPQASDVKDIMEHMAHLRPLVGTWDADYEFHNRDGTVDIVEPGTFKVSWVLDNTYLEIQTEHHRPEDPSRYWTYFTFITYDPVTMKYVCTFFYGRWSQRVTEDGVFDERTKELRTIGLVSLEDGKRDEHVRNIYRLTGTDAPTVIHYSRYSDESSERMDLVIKLRRSEKPPTKSSTDSKQHG